MTLRRRILWPKRRLRCARIGHRWQTVHVGDDQRFDYCTRCSKRQAR
ncbi:MAG TPA: hypothetical protein VFQ71_04210 [Gaiellales bacterium]|jgi:hypothetical protein|nr:hypothetical protein [Gaiellales bacterium]